MKGGLKLNRLHSDAWPYTLLNILCFFARQKNPTYQSCIIGRPKWFKLFGWFITSWNQYQLMTNVWSINKKHNTNAFELRSDVLIFKYDTWRIPFDENTSLIGLKKSKSAFMYLLCILWLITESSVCILGLSDQVKKNKKNPYFYKIFIWNKVGCGVT